MLHDKPSEIQQGIQDKLHGMRCPQPPKNKSENNPWTHTATSSQPTSKALSTNAAGRCNFSFTARTKKSAAHWGSCGGTNSAFKKAKADMSSRVGPSAMLTTDSTLATCKEIPAFASSSHSLPTHMWDSGPPPPPFKMAGECNCCLQMPTKQLLLVCGQKCQASKNPSNSWNWIWWSPLSSNKFHKADGVFSLPISSCVGPGDHLPPASTGTRPHWGRSALQVLQKHPYPYRGGGRGGQNQPVKFHLFFPSNPGIEIQPLKWNCKVTFLNKPWALVRKYLRLAPSMMTAAQFLEGCHPYTCAASVWHVLSSSAPPELSASI